MKIETGSSFEAAKSQLATTLLGNAAVALGIRLVFRCKSPAAFIIFTVPGPSRGLE
jgi:hypothetical protein